MPKLGLGLPVDNHLGVSPPPPPPPPTMPELYAYYTFDNHTLDQTVNARHLFGAGGFYSPMVINDGIRFVNLSYTPVTPDPLTMENGCAFSFWVRGGPSTPNDTTLVEIAGETSAGGYQTFNFKVDSVVIGSDTLKFTATVDTGVGPVTLESSGSQLNADLIHIVVSYDTAPFQGITLWINSVKAGQEYFGLFSDIESFLYNMSTLGYLDEVAIFKGPLVQALVDQLYNGGSGHRPFTES